MSSTLLACHHRFVWFDAAALPQSVAAVEQGSVGFVGLALHAAREWLHAAGRL